MISRLTALALMFSLINACTPIGAAVTAGATAGTYALEERGIRGAASDLGLKAQIINNWFQANVDYTTDLTVIVYNGKAMVTGSVDTEAQRSQAIEVVWKTEGVRDVFNEIRLKQSYGIEDFAHDKYIETKLFTTLTFNSDIKDINYKTEVDGGIVYVIGLAQNRQELNSFIAQVKSISYVKRVISHMEIKSSP